MSEIVGAVTDIALNAILIPHFASAGAAIGTLVAEFVVLIVQFYSLRFEVLDAFKAIHYFKILVALVLGSIVSLWVKALQLGSFLSLLISALLFFGMYGGTLLLLKEALVNEIVMQVLGKFIKKAKK